jgi:uncharacterized protein with HEPN domain
MYSERNLIYILTILECIEKTWIYTKEFDNPTDFIWANEQKELNATISLFIAIGEESKKIEQVLKDAIQSNFLWKDVAGLRDKISHDYRGVNPDILWSVIHKDLSKLKSSLIEMMHLINPPRELLKKFLSTPHYKHIQYLIN